MDNSERSLWLSEIKRHFLTGNEQPATFEFESASLGIWRPENARPLLHLKVYVATTEFPGDPDIRMRISAGTATSNGNLLSTSIELKTGKVRQLRIVDIAGQLKLNYDDTGELQSEQAWAANLGVQALDEFIKQLGKSAGIGPASNAPGFN